MTQPEADPKERQSADAADEGDAPEASTSPEAAGRMDLSDLLAQGLRSAARSEPESSLLDEEPPDDTDDTEEDDEESAEEDGLDDTEDEESEEDEQPDELTNWAESIVKNPKALSRIPAEQRVAAIDRAIKTVRQSTVAEQQGYAREALTAVAQAAYDKGMAEGRDLASAEVEFAEIEAMVTDDDAAALGTLIRDNPDQWDRYRQWKKSGQARPAPGANGAGKPGEAPRLDPAIVEQASDTMEKVKQAPGALERMQANEAKSPGIYAPTAEGLRRLQSDAIDAIAEARAAELRKKDEPSRKAAERRRQAAKDRKDLPRVPGGEGRTGGREALPPDLSPRDYIAMGISKSLES